MRDLVKLIETSRYLDNFIYVMDFLDRIKKFHVGSSAK